MEVEPNTIHTLNEEMLLYQIEKICVEPKTHVVDVEESSSCSDQDELESEDLSKRT